MEGIKMRVVDPNNLDEKPKVEETKTEVQQEENKDEKLQEQEQSQDEQKQVESNVQEQKEEVKENLETKEDKVIEKQSVEQPKQETEIPEDIKSYLDARKENKNLSYQDFLELQKDWKNEDSDVTLKRYLKDKNPYFTDEDIKDELSEFSFDEDVDDESEIRKKKREKRKLLSEAVSYLESQKEQYKTPTEGSSETSDVSIPDEYRQAKTRLSEIESQQEQQQQLFQQRQKEFLNETKSIFNEEFKGFEFDINGEKKLFRSAEAKELLDVQSDINNAISKFTDKEGKLVDVQGYHKFLNAGLNADKIAKHFYELGQSETIKQETSDSKNINLSGHKPKDDFRSKGGIKMKAVEPNGNKFKLRY